MRIGVDVSQALPEPRDGIGHFTAELVRALIALSEAQGRGDEIVLFGLSRPIEPAVFRSQFPDCPHFVRLSDGYPKSSEIDVFHCTAGSFPLSFSGPTIFTCYDLTILTHPHHHTVGNKLHWLTATLEAQVADATFLTISRASARELEEHLDLPSSRIRVVHPAAATVFRRLAAGEAQQRISERFSIEGSFVLAVGTLEPRKNLDRLLRAHEGLPEELRRRCPLVLAGGEGWKLDDVKFGAARRLGYVDREDLVALYNAATVFAYPSLAEGFGLPVVEAMACGAPVLTSNVSSLPEVAGDAARLVDPRDVVDIRRQLRELLEEPSERDLLRERGRERANRFSWKETARQIVELYQELDQKDCL